MVLLAATCAGLRQFAFALPKHAPGGFFGIAPGLGVSGVWSRVWCLQEDVDTIINETNETNELREYQVGPSPVHTDAALKKP